MSISAFLQGKDFFVCDPEASRRFVCQVVHPRFYFDSPARTAEQSGKTRSPSARDKDSISIVEMPSLGISRESSQ